MSSLGTYYLILFTAFFCISIYQNSPSFTSLSITLLLFIILLLFGEFSILRFADSHSYIISSWLVCVAITIISQDILTLIALIFISNPSPIFNLFCMSKPSPWIVPPRKPIHVSNAIDRGCKFLSHVNKNGKVLVQFENPRGNYNNIFDGYRNVYELLLHCGSKCQLNLFPDWYFINDTNHDEGIEVWGRELTDVFKTKEKFSFNYFISYETNSKKLPNSFKTDPRIKEISSLDLSEFKEDFSPDPPYGIGEKPIKFYLFKLIEIAS
jgi:hypothetical protein